MTTHHDADDHSLAFALYGDAASEAACWVGYLRRWNLHWY